MSKDRSTIYRNRRVSFGEGFYQGKGDDFILFNILWFMVCILPHLLLMSVPIPNNFLKNKQYFALVYKCKIKSSRRDRQTDMYICLIQSHSFFCFVFFYFSLYFWFHNQIATSSLRCQTNRISECFLVDIRWH